ncbi:ribonuclease R [Desulfopila sp. IMCC35008]|uniref:ribonuclease R n=1 Tax=Desulfopila sp. IMCC35008 TaxID=2653858 RepID=UPI0013D7582B|nr:ribonuclease R [Desulfopila sp. IMCC35008]
MAKKRQARTRSRVKNDKRRSQPQLRARSRAIENSIIRFLYASGSPATIQELTREISGKRRPDSDIHTVLTGLLNDRIVVKAGKSRYTLADNAPLYTGTLQLHPRGFGFIPVERQCTKAPKPEHDIYVSARKMGSAMQGDKLLIRLLTPHTSDRPEGSVISIIERGPDTVAGLFKREGKHGLVYPEDPRFPFVIRVSQKQHPDLKDNIYVIARFVQPEKPDRYLTGTITEILGSPDNIDVQMRLVIEKHRLPHLFSDETIAEAKALPEVIETSGDREDLRSILHVTIDGETAKDFDDAIAVEKNRNGYRLYVSIADVSHFVQPGSALDRDAYQRGTSIYFPGRVIPMLPEKISNNLCSLVPEEDRLTVTAILDFDSQGKRVAKRYCRSVIRSHKRFTYTEVQAILDDTKGSIAKENKRFLEMLQDAERLARQLREQRIERGSIGFTLPEPEITLKEDGTIDSIKRAKRDFSHQLIEEFMLAANEAVAETFTQHRRTCLYRIHELPDRAKVVEFATFAKTLDLDLPKPELKPQWFGIVLDLCQDSPKEYIVNNLLLRTMQQARYSTENKGHFALASEDYTHFTSPIRRYPDLIVHRELCQLLEEKQKGIARKTSSLPAEDSGEFLSGRERAAVTSEREMNDRLKMLYMEKRLGTTFPAIISGVTDFAFFIELLDLFISGSVPIESLEDDYYLFDGKHHRLIGEVSGRTFQIGDIITVKAETIDKEKNRIIFSPTSTE